MKDTFGESVAEPRGEQQGKRWLVTGGSGFLGGYLWRRLPRDVEAVSLGRRRARSGSERVRHLSCDLGAKPVLPVEAVRELAPSVVLHLAALTDVALCEREPARAERLNEVATRALAEAVRESCERFIYVSTDLVFDGETGGYREADEPRPLSVYGRTKLAGERAARSVLAERVVVARLALLYGRSRDAGSRQSFADVLIERARAGQNVPLFTDQFRTPLHVEDAAESLVRLGSLASVPEVLHLGGDERVSRYDMALLASEALGFSREPLLARRMEDVPSSAARPVDVSLDSTLARRLGLPARALMEGFRDWARDG